MDRPAKPYVRSRTPSISSDSEIFEPVSSNNAKIRATLLEWINSILPELRLPINASDEELRGFLVDGTILCLLLNKLKPGSVPESVGSHRSSQSHLENVQRFVSAMDEMGFPRFLPAELEKGSMKIVMDCLFTLKTHFTLNNGSNATSKSTSREQSFKVNSSPPFGEDSRKNSKVQRGLRTPTVTEPPAAVFPNNVGHKFHEVFQLKQGSYTDLPASRITEMMKSNSLDNAPTQSLLSVVNGILDESIERKKGEIPHRVACLLRKVVQEIERRISTQAEHLRTQNNLFKAREEKYQSRIRVLEALAMGTSEETQIVTNQLQHVKNEKNKTEDKKKVEDQDMVRLMKEKDDLNQKIANLRQELEKVTKSSEQEIANLKQELEKARKSSAQLSVKVEAGSIPKAGAVAVVGEAQKELEDKLKAAGEDQKELVEKLKAAGEDKKELVEKLKAAGEDQKELVDKLKAAGEAQREIEDKLKEAEKLLTDSRNTVKQLEASYQSKSEQWNKKEQIYHGETECQLGILRELKFASQSIQQEVVKTQKSYIEDFGTLESRIKALDHAAKNYYSVLFENRKLHNELQDLKGNIRVYCRVRPFLPRQKGKETIVEYVGENGELVILNPSKQGKEARRSFKFDKVYGPKATQAEVFSDTQPLIQSVLDGYNVCIFAYGQTGSGKTYTMTGPDGATEAEWGVNYRALNDLFRISQSRESTFKYDVSVQMVEIYNEKVRDLLSNDGAQKKLEILSTSQPNGLAVPDASVHAVSSTPDVLKLMDIGLKNRARSSTALNERSSRSHSVVSIHARGNDLKSGSTLRGSLHLVDLAGSERVDRSEVTGDRLKEAQHINKSLSALGDVIFALAQKSSHVPYRNSKLTQVLQSSLGGQAKTLMFVQLNPDTTSYSESFSTLKFAERVSGVELGAAKSSKDGRDVRELMEQVATLKDTIAKKDEEIESLQKGR